MRRLKIFIFFLATSPIFIMFFFFFLRITFKHWEYLFPTAEGRLWAWKFRSEKKSWSWRARGYFPSPHAFKQSNGRIQSGYFILPLMTPWLSTKVEKCMVLQGYIWRKGPGLHLPCFIYIFNILIPLWPFWSYLFVTSGSHTTNCTFNILLCN